ncbi:TPA: hypothetical protein DCZ32_04790 [Candidatus Uhrbacteria bacterium]|nr:hypothetical protein [Candidatus Uhrbacteria bacterium]
MIIPKQFKAFKQPTLVVLAGQNKVYVYLGKDRQFELVSTFKTPGEWAFDKEGFEMRSSRVGGRMRTTGSVSNEKQDWREHVMHDHLYPQAIESIKTQLKSGLAQKVVVFAENKHLAIFKAKVKNSFGKNISFISKNFLKSPPEQILKSL